MQLKLWIAVAAIPLSSTMACAMDAESFYIKGLALQKKGMAAMFSSDLKPVVSEFETAAKSVKAENDGAKAAGNPIYCAPKKTKMSPDQLLAEFGKIPMSHRKAITVKAAWREIVVRKYPC